jgi:hypothetical protein
LHGIPCCLLILNCSLNWLSPIHIFIQLSLSF